MLPRYLPLMQLMNPGGKMSMVSAEVSMNVSNLINTESFKRMGLEVLIINYTDPKVN